ncbi:CIC11C00000004472 [Sungouiella intermedia]|uniref:CIC11C00000004472 n=1 Tax=Sungouiella intermedia TaxID=45354 RepID=A0A1L0DGF4_9ASCO|nr:CIC11C00000004472 [[Candida] intermedia]
MTPPYKIVLLGDSSVGKTSLVHRFTTDSFDPHLANTIGAAFISKEHTASNRSIKFEIWDTAGQERYKSLTPMYYRNSKVALVCFDMSLPDESFERARYWIEQLAILGPPDIKIKVVGNKEDLGADANLLMIQEFCGDRNLSLVTTSAKTGKGIVALFDQITDEIEQEFFDKYQEEQAANTNDDRILLNMRMKQTGCC